MLALAAAAASELDDGALTSESSISTASPKDVAIITEE